MKGYSPNNTDPIPTGKTENYATTENTGIDVSKVRKWPIPNQDKYPKLYKRAMNNMFPYNIRPFTFLLGIITGHRWYIKKLYGKK